MNNNITYIDINEILPHPINPRKEVGDVSELAESIKKNGIMQNLTVIVHEGKYRCLIGHRRLAAAKTAGLEQVPCVIKKNIPLVDQIAIMLSENIQRNDLTKIEQIDGMQMMLDLGDTADGISEKTGLSESTVRRRLKLLEYGRDKIEQAFERGATFSDFEKLNDISDPKVREEVAEKIGTYNFKWAYENAVDEEKRQTAFENAKEIVKSYAEEITVDEAERLDLCYYDNITPWRAEKWEKPDNAGTVKYWYIFEKTVIRLYRERTPEEKAKKEIEQKNQEAENDKRRKLGERIAKLESQTDIAAVLRHKFILSCEPLRGCNSQKDQLAAYKKLCGFMVQAYIEFNFNKWDVYDIFLNNMGFDVTEEFDEMELEEQSTAVEKYIYKLRNGEVKAMFAAIISLLGDDETYYYKYGSDSGKHKPSSQLDFVYEMLCDFGYKMSDAEKQLQDGTHELFRGNDDEA